MIGDVANVPAFGAAIVHALVDGIWVGATVAVALHFFFKLNRGLNAATRHAAWYAALVVIAAMPVVSFSVSLAHIQIVTAPAAAVAHVLDANSALHDATHADTASISHSPTSSIASLVSDLNPRFVRNIALAAGAMVAAIAIVRLAFLVAGLFGLARVKRASRIIGPSIAPRLARAVAIEPSARAVDVRVSDDLDAPAAAGFRTPAILLPAGLVESLDSDALDQIAMHEYAHLRRYDDWTNLAQRFFERLYWFNPAIWFVASRIDLEREIACDDWAVAGVERVSGYADCLWQLARDGRVPAFAATAPGAFLTRNQIVARIEHLLERRRDGAPFSRPSKLIAVMPVLAAALALVAGRAPAIAVHVAPTRTAHVDVRIAPVPVVQVRVVALDRLALERSVLERSALERSALADRPTVAKPTRPQCTARPAIHVVIPALHVAGPAIRVIVRETVRKASIEKLVERTIQVNVRNADSTARSFAPAVVAAADLTDNSPSGAINRNLLAHCMGCDLSNKDLRNADLHELTLTGDDLSGADLRGADLHGSVLTGVDLSNARLDGANLRDTVFTGADISGASFAGAKVDGIKLVGMQLTNALFASTSARAILNACAGCDLSGLDLRNKDLHGITLDGADLHGADLSGANLSGAHLNGVDLGDAKLIGTDLTNAVMNGCDLSGVDLSHAHTQGLILQGSTVS